MAAQDHRLVGADRVLAVLVELGDHPRGTSLEHLAEILDSPKPTIHRALVSLRRAGLATQIGRGEYVLGDEFLRIAFDHAAARPEAQTITPLLERLTQELGETAHYAVLDGAEVIYRAKTDPAGRTVRLSSVIGGRNPAYCTAVGRLLLSRTVPDPDRLAEIVGPGPFPRRTDRTRTSLAQLWEELEATRERGYGVDAQENEEGIHCIAVPIRVPGGPPEGGAVSVSALAFRTPFDELVAAVPRIREILADLPR